MDYSFIIDDFTWSFTRLSCYEQCPHQFYLQYLMGIEDGDNFFSEFGTLMHDLHERYFKGELTKEQLPIEYATGFDEAIQSPAYKKELKEEYFNNGWNYWQTFDYGNNRIVDVETTGLFHIGDYQFTGRLDLIEQDADGALIITDHKSAKLEPRKRKKTEKIGKLDTYLRQLYLYSELFKDRYGRFPDYLQFNCFRTGTKVIEPFDPSRFEEAVEWATNIIEKARHDAEFISKPNFFFCQNLCGLKEYCTDAESVYTRKKRDGAE